MKAIIIDDEPIARRGMRRLIDKHPELTLVAEFDSASKAKDWLDGNDTDLIFLDIEMPGMNGIEFARQLPEKNMVIFTTAYSEYAVDGFELDALDYLVKPIDPARFEKAIQRAVSYKALVDDAEKSEPETDLEYIIVKADRKYVRIKLEDILYIEGLKDYMIIHLPDRRIVTRMTIKAMEEQLPKSCFLRVNKSYIVNRDKIDSFNSNDINIGSMEIAIGLSYRDSVLAKLLS